MLTMRSAACGTSGDGPVKDVLGIKQSFVRAALTPFFEIRKMPGLNKESSTSQTPDWMKLLLIENLTAEDLRTDLGHNLPKLNGALFKNEQDVNLFERLAFLTRGCRA